MLLLLQLQLRTVHLNMPPSTTTKAHHLLPVPLVDHTTSLQQVLVKRHAGRYVITYYYTKRTLLIRHAWVITTAVIADMGVPALVPVRTSAVHEQVVAKADIPTVDMSSGV